MKRFALLVALSVFSRPVLSQAQQNPTSGNILLEQEAVIANPYKTNQTEAITHFQKLDENVRSGTIVKTTLSDQAINYLAAVYLLCTSGNGTCPAILNAVLETDVLNAKISGKAECPYMTKLWSFWQGSDMEKRHQYLMKVPDAEKYSAFQRTNLPYFKNCSEAVSKALEEKGDNAKFIATRYTTSGSPTYNIFASVAGLLTTIEKKVPNVFINTGIASSAPASSERK